MSKTFTILGIASVFLLISGGAMAWSLYTITSSGVLLEEKIEQIAEKNAQVKMYTELSRLIEGSEQSRQKLSEFLLTESDTSRFLTSLERASTFSGVVLSTQSLKVVPSSGKFDNLFVEFILEGESDAMDSMLSVIESLPYHSQIETLTFVRFDETKVRASVGLNVTLGKYAE